MKALVIGVVLVFLGGCASLVRPGGKAIETPIKEYFGQVPIERRAFGQCENAAEAEDSPLPFRLTPCPVAPGA
ncbi:hypothetical protein [Pseudomonas aeruginosa]|uniref:hypothetical protein n=1 Tax=Pseudomonas aeruginosa TaxID=287 RepID=UPI003CC5AD76